MLKIFKQLGFDRIFKIILLVFVAYFLFLLTCVVVSLKNNSEIGRYQFDKSGSYIIDTKTGKTIESDQNYR